VIQKFPKKPIPGIEKTITKLKETFNIVVYSSRCKTKKGRNAIKTWLKINKIDIKVANSKPPAYLYIDDRAVCFNGNWDELLVNINNFSHYIRNKQWNE